jgi:hypothetical protein
VLPEQPWYAQADSVDPRPWAAYIIGHHPRVLKSQQEDFWERFTLRIAPEDQTLPIAVRRTVLELNEALHVLAQADCVRSAVLVETHRVLDQMAGSFIEAVAEPFPWKLTRLPLWHPSGLNERLIQSCGRLLQDESHLATWWELGDNLGAACNELRSALSGPSGLEKPFPSAWTERMTTLATLGERLDANGSMSLLNLIETHAHASANLSAIYRVMCRMDLEVQSRLMHVDPPEYQMVVGQVELSVLGHSQPLDTLTPREAACLAVLAESPGIRIARKTIIERSRQRIAPAELLRVMTGLRATLIRLAKASSAGADPKRVWIGGMRRRGTALCPLWLEVEAGLVKIDA